MVNNLGPYPPETLDQANPLHQILMPLFYFEIFSYPLTAEELAQLNPGSPLDQTEFDQALEVAMNRGWVYEHQGYYSCQNTPDWVERRLDNNKRASRYIRHAYRMVQLIRRFPFVRAVFLSGALSKNVMPRDGDIDYFIVTKPGRLWVSRTLLVLFKKIFLLNSHKFLCVNYFIDEENLLIEEQNQFTATEVITLMPLYNEELYGQFMAQNKWTFAYYPNFPLRNIGRTKKRTGNLVQKTLEFILSGKMGDTLDQYFFNRTLKYWQKKFANFDPSKFSNALKSSPHVSKHHPQDFQNRVLNRLEELIQGFEQQHQVVIERPNIGALSVQTDK